MTLVQAYLYSDMTNRNNSLAAYRLLMDYWPVYVPPHSKKVRPSFVKEYRCYD